tara:strand:- start:1848 stop:2102 length:255 start_codon:yes stop_codon:yes gene_type:complete
MIIKSAQVKRGDLYKLCESEHDEKFLLVVGFEHEMIEVTGCYKLKDDDEILKYTETFLLTETDVICVGEFSENVYDKTHSEVIK